MNSLPKVLMIGMDRNIFIPTSVIRERIKMYAQAAEEIHIVIFTLSSLGFEKQQIEPNVWVYPTNSLLKWFYPLDAARLGKSLVKERQFIRGRSLIATQDPFECGWAGLKVKKRWRIPLEVQLHTDPFSPYFKGFQNAVRKRFVKKILRNADGVRVVTESLKLKVSKFTKAGISVLPIYVDKKKIEDARITFDLHSRYPWHFILLAVSRLAPEKNLEFALEVLARVRESFPSTGLVIVGSGSEEGRLKLKVKSLKLEGVVEFVGWQDPARTTGGVQSGGDLASFYKTANAFIQTSLFEGYGLSLVEAGLSGLPVITTPVGIANELEHGKDAYIYPAGNVALFASGVVDLIENNHKRENLCMNMKRVLESKLISKEDYTLQVKTNWVETSKKVKT
jgi:glycosyltransferase involved in cell wall biosynthesis